MPVTVISDEVVVVAFIVMSLTLTASPNESVPAVIETLLVESRVFEKATAPVEVILSSSIAAASVKVKLLFEL